MAVMLNGNAVQVPNVFVGNLVEEAIAETPFAKLSTQRPMPMTAGEMRISRGGVVAGFVAEGGKKPVSDPQYDTVVLTPRKVATIVLASEEAAKLDPFGQIKAIEGQLRNAITAAITNGIVNGTDLRTGSALPNVTSLSQTANRVKADKSQGVTAQSLMQAYQLAEAGSNASDPNGMLLDNSTRGQLLQLASFGVGAPNGAFAAPIADLKQRAAVIGGLDAVFAKNIASAGKGLGYVGDFEHGLTFGFGMDLTLKTSTDGTIVDDAGNVVSLWQTNQIGYLAEAIVTWHVDTRMFAAIDAAA